MNLILYSGAAGAHHDLWVSSSCWWAPASWWLIPGIVYLPCPLWGAYNDHWSITYYIPGERTPGRQWRHRIIAISPGRTQLDPTAWSPTFWRGVTWPLVLGLSPSRVQVIRDNPSRGISQQKITLFQPLWWRAAWSTTPIVLTYSGRNRPSAGAGDPPLIESPRGPFIFLTYPLDSMSWWRFPIWTP